ncbi:MAG: hypothetical protein R3E39_29155 [Anaerolineae bacterium]
MNTIQRYWRAFVQALRLTLRGEKLTPPSTTPLEQWAEQYEVLVEALLRTADEQGVNKMLRKQIMLRVDGRQISLETAVATLQFHAKQEYASLIRSGRHQHLFNALQAGVMNDRYWLTQITSLHELQSAPLQTSLSLLGDHLDLLFATIDAERTSSSS